METGDYMEKLMHLIDEGLKSKQRLIVAIDGMAAAGKSTLAARLQSHYNCSVIHMDDYFVPAHLQTQERQKEIGGNIDYERFQAEVISHLQEDTIHLSKFDCKSQTLSQEYHVELGSLVIIEGAYSLRKEWQKYYDIKVLYTIDGEEQKRRLKIRNEQLYHRFIQEWIPKELSYIKETNLRAIVDLIIE